MTTLLIGLLLAALLAAMVGFLLYIKERTVRRNLDEKLLVIIQIGQIDDRIFRMRMDDPEEWPESREAQMLIAHRIKLHEEYSKYLGHQLLRECTYMNEIKDSLIAK